MNPQQDMSRLQIWLLASRPKTLWAGIVPVIIGGAMALETGVFHVLSFVAALAGSILIQVGTNFANDLFDYLKDVDDHERIGPLRVTQAGLVSPSAMKTATIAVFTLALLIGVYLVWRGGWPIVIIGLSSILFGVMYTGGPYPLGYHGLGDIFVLIFYGPVAVCGTYYVITLDYSTTILLAGIPPGMLSSAILTVNNLRDYDTDLRTGKKTLAVRFGRTFARSEYIAMVVASAFFPLLIYVHSDAHPYAILTVLMLLPGIFAIRSVLRDTSGEALNHTLATTGRLLALYGLLFSVGWNI